VRPTRTTAAYFLGGPLNGRRAELSAPEVGRGFRYDVPCLLNLGAWRAYVRGDRGEGCFGYIRYVCTGRRTSSGELVFRATLADS